MDVNIDAENVTRIQVKEDYPTAMHGNSTRISIIPLNTTSVQDIVLYVDNRGDVYLRVWNRCRDVVEVSLIKNGDINGKLIEIGIVNDEYGGSSV